MVNRTGIWHYILITNSPEYTTPRLWHLSLLQSFFFGWWRSSWEGQRGRKTAGFVFIPVHSYSISEKSKFFNRAVEKSCSESQALWMPDLFPYIIVTFRWKNPSIGIVRYYRHPPMELLSSYCNKYINWWCSVYDSALQTTSITMKMVEDLLSCEGQCLLMFISYWSLLIISVHSVVWCHPGFT